MPSPPTLLADPEPRIGVDELGDDAVRVSLEYWIENPAVARFPIRSAVAREVLDRFERGGRSEPGRPA
jgi:small-conductance mechanosensitive channel